MYKLVAAFLLLSGCAKVDASIPSICANKYTLPFMGLNVPPGTPIDPFSSSFSIPTGLDANLLTKVDVVSGTISLEDGSSLGFLDEVLIQAVNPNDGTTLDLWNVKAPNTDTTMINIQNTNTDLLNYIDKNNNLTINIVISTQNPPHNNWTLDIGMCVSASLDKEYQL